jgi:molybdopterin converting factor small subunit
MAVTVRFIDGLDAAVPEGDTVAVVSAVAGGCPDLR